MCYRYDNTYCRNTVTLSTKSFHISFTFTTSTPPPPTLNRVEGVYPLGNKACKRSAKHFISLVNSKRFLNLLRKEHCTRGEEETIRGSNVGLPGDALHRLPEDMNFSPRKREGEKRRRGEENSRWRRDDEDSERERAKKVEDVKSDIKSGNSGHCIV